MSCCLIICFFVFFFSSRRRHTICALVTGVQTCALPIYPAALEQHALKIVEQMKGLKEIRAPRIEGDIPRPEIIITPRLDLAADIGVTPAALRPTIRIATLGVNAQNAARLSRSDRKITSRVLLSEAPLRNTAHLEQT